MKNPKACKKDIDSTATKWPYCQTHQRAWFKTPKTLTALLPILAVLIVISVGSACNTPQDTQSTQTTTDNNTPQDTQSKWNTTELDPVKNGNVPIAVNLLKDASDTEIKGKAEDLNPATVFKTPWDYYGRIVKFSGVTGLVQDYPPDSDASKAFGGGAASEIVLLTEDGTIVDCMKIGPTGSIREGDTVVVYGYPVGRMDVPNALGGTFTHLIVICKTVEQITP